MTIKIEIDCDNAAFEDRPGDEVARILRALAASVDGFSKVGLSRGRRSFLRDINGNCVGMAEVVGE